MVPTKKSAITALAGYSPPVYVLDGLIVRCVPSGFLLRFIGRFRDVCLGSAAARKEENMSKMKTRKAAAKRMTVTATGKIKHRKAGLTHLQTKRSSRTQQRNNNGAESLSKADYKSAHRMMPHAS